MSFTLRSVRRIVPLFVLLSALGVPLAGSAQQGGERAPSSLLVVHPDGGGPEAEAVHLELVVEGVAGTATAARAASQLGARRVALALGGSGLSVDGIRVWTTQLFPEHADPGVVPVSTIRQDRRVAGYRAVTGLRVTVRDPRHLGLLVDLAHGAGAQVPGGDPLAGTGAGWSDARSVFP